MLVSAGWSLLTLSGLYWLYDLRQIEKRSSMAKALTLPLKIYGSNALVAYAVSVAGHKLSRTKHVKYDGHDVSLRTYMYRRVFAPERLEPGALAGLRAGLCCALPGA